MSDIDVPGDWENIDTVGGWRTTTSNTVTLDKSDAGVDVLAMVLRLEEMLLKQQEDAKERERFQVIALIILGVLALCGLGATTWLLAVGVSAEAALAVFGLSNLSAGAVAGALTLGKKGG